MSSPKPLHLLLAVGSANRAEEIGNSLRHHSVITRSQFVDSAEALAPHLEGDNWDVLLCSADAEGEPARALIGCVQRSGSHLRVVLLDDTTNPERLTEGLQWGAADVVSADADTRLALVLRREHDYVGMRRRWQQAETAFAEAEGRNQLLLESSKAAIAYVHEGMHVHANAAYLDLFGFEDEDDLAGVPLLDMVAADTVPHVRERMKRFPMGDSTQPFDFVGHTAGGAEVRGTILLSEAAFEGEECMQVLIRPPAVAAAVEPEPDRHEHAMAQVAAVCESGTGALLYLHVDDVPALRAQVGVTHFDEVMEQVRNVCRTVVQDDTQVLRFTDTTLVVPLAGVSGDAALSVAERMRTAVANNMVEIGERTVQATCTIGVAVLDVGMDAEALVERAHEASNEADGRDSVSMAGSAEAPEGGAEDAPVLLRVQRALDEHGFALVFQPIISLRGDNDEHYEVFLRLPGEDGELEPDQFIHVAVANDLGSKLDRWVVLQSIKVLSAHRASGHDTRLTINLTGASVLDPSFLPWLAVAIKAARLPSDAVIFQISEEDAANITRQAQAFTEGLHELHCRTSLSHFGMSVNPFGTLRHLSIDYVKIDGSFVLDDERRGALPDTISSLQAQGKLTIVPMVESAAVLSSLWQAGANYIQGHYLQEPSREMDYDFANDT